jgi:succinate-semialdehyde dehydrogenase/glutarate-semialdehyde dehydrogenase
MNKSNKEVKSTNDLAALLSDPSLLKAANLINGAWVGSRSERMHPVLNPANGATIASVPFSDADDTTDAINAAHKAFPAWAKRTTKDRAALLKRWYELIIANKNDLGVILAAEQGKPLQESIGEVAYGAGFIEWFAEEGKRAYGDVIPPHAPDKRLVVIKQAVGVVGLITPWNFPSAMITRKASAALAAGCSVVLKPAEDTPLSALALGELALRAGIPAGVLNIVVTGAPAPIGATLTAHPAVRKLSFTGSTRVGKLLLNQCSDGIKKVSLELGGNAAFIVFDDADLDAAIAGLMAVKFRNTGQTCISANRIFVQDGIYERFADKLVQAVAKLRTGNPLDTDMQQGPLINQAAIDKVNRIVNDAVSRGARAAIGGQPHANGGLFYQPTVLVDVSKDAQLWTEEIFGPVAPLIRFGNEEEVVALANDTPYGLASYFYSRDIGRAWRVAEALECGMVGVNEGSISTELAPFGGVKESGIGREGSKYGLLDYLETKFICFGGI